MAHGSYPGGPPDPYRQQPQVYMPQPDKSYVGPALITWLLYYVGFWLVGLVINIVYLSEAARYTRETRRPASGVGCLWALLIFHLVMPIVGIIVLLVTGLGAVIIAAIMGQGG